MEHNEGALLRVLGTVERRGFVVLDLNADKPDAGSYALALTLAGSRDADVLCRQLQRLVEVRAVRLLPEPAEDAVVPGFHATWLQG